MAKPNINTPATRPEFYHHPNISAYECLGCGQFIEIPRQARLKVYHSVQLVEVRDNPENLAIFRELHEIAHARCATFKDAEKAKQHREYGLKQIVAIDQAKALAKHVLGVR